MLIKFNFKNYKSFRDEAILGLSAAKMTEFSDQVVTIGNERILPVAAIYGANTTENLMYTAHSNICQNMLSILSNMEMMKNLISM